VANVEFLSGCVRFGDSPELARDRALAAAQVVAEEAASK
jgi:predicted RNase H-like HicB family nuclease